MFPRHHLGAAALAVLACGLAFGGAEKLVDTTLFECTERPSGDVCRLVRTGGDHPLVEVPAKAP